MEVFTPQKSAGAINYLIFFFFLFACTFLIPGKQFRKCALPLLLLFYILQGLLEFLNQMAALGWSGSGPSLTSLGWDAPIPFPLLIMQVAWYPPIMQGCAGRRGVPGPVPGHRRHLLMAVLTPLTITLGQRQEVLEQNLTLTIFLAVLHRGQPSRSRGAIQGLPGPGNPCTSSFTSAALSARRARVQQRPAFLPYSWKSSIYALRPPPFFYIFFPPG